MPDKTMPDNIKSAMQKASEVLGDKYVQSHDAADEKWIVNSMRDKHGSFAFLAFPHTTAEITALIEIAREHGLSLTPQGGNTGRCDGATPDDKQNIMVNLKRMDKILSLDAAANVVQVEAGCILQNIKDAATEAKRFFPLSLGAEGSCTIGGNIATNAGGINTVRYGNCREQVLGLEAVLANGEVWNGMRPLRKDNSGYDLKHLFIGSEGTLGIITKASLRLYPQAQELTTAMIGVRDLPQALWLFGRANEICGNAIVAFEIVPRIAQEFVAKYQADYRAPLSDEWLVIMQAEHAFAEEAESVQEKLAELSEASSLPAVLAVNEAQRQEIWRLRELTTAVQSAAGLSLKHDVSLPIAAIPQFYEAAAEALPKICEGVRIYGYGHLGDGNLHYNLTVPEGMSDAEFSAYGHDLGRCVYDLVAELGGSFSAEHGIGRTKTELLHHYKPPLEWNMQKRIKTLFDPDGIFNRGVIFDA